jgi:hypothetical protein
MSVLLEAHAANNPDTTISKARISILLEDYDIRTRRVVPGAARLVNRHADTAWSALNHDRVGLTDVHL